MSEQHQCLEKIEREAERGDATDHPLGRRQTSRRRAKWAYASHCF